MRVMTPKQTAADCASEIAPLRTERARRIHAVCDRLVGSLDETLSALLRLDLAREPSAPEKPGWGFSLTGRDGFSPVGRSPTR
jgi:hypothetical protein